MTNVRAVYTILPLGYGMSAIGGLAETLRRHPAWPINSSDNLLPYPPNVAEGADK